MQLWTVPVDAVKPWCRAQKPLWVALPGKSFFADRRAVECLLAQVLHGHGKKISSCHLGSEDSAGRDLHSCENS